MTHTTYRSGQLAGSWLSFLGSIFLLGILIVPLLWDPSRWFAARGETLVVYCAAGIMKPVEAAARAYEREYGVTVQLNYGGSQTLLANVELSEHGDLYLPADDTYIQMARDRDLLDETIPLATMSPVLAVARGNPKNVQSLDDLMRRKEVRVAQANPDAAAIGKLSRDMLHKSGHWSELKRRTLVFKPTVNDVANDIKAGTVDAGIVWDATVQQYPDLERVPIPELEQGTAHISIGVLRCTRQPTAALRFARYLAARDRGLVEFEQHGFRTVVGDIWEESPRLHLSVGAMLRPAIEETIAAFEEREGVEVVRVYNGCGILVSEIKSGKHPDAFFACDASFMKQVKDLFLDSVDVSTNQLVILVPRDNPYHIKTLEDLAKPGVRIGVGHEQQCALGVLTQRTLQQSGYAHPVMKNVKVQKPTGDGLVNDLRVGALDAIIAYVSNAAAAGDELLAFPVDVPCALAIQPMAVGKDSDRKHLSERLQQAIRSQASREIFEKNGFRWRE